MITASVFVSCSNDDDPADFSDENIQHGPICGLLIGRFGGFAPSECNYGIISYILVRDFITLLLQAKTFIILCKRHSAASNCFLERRKLIYCIL